MNTYWIACTVYMTACAIACIWLFAKAKKEHDCAMWTLRATDDLMCRAVKILQDVDKDVDRLKADVEKTKGEIDGLKLKVNNLPNIDLYPDCVKELPNVARYCAPRKTAPIDWEDEDE